MIRFGSTAGNDQLIAAWYVNIGTQSAAKTRDRIIESIRARRPKACWLDAFSGPI